MRLIAAILMIVSAPALAESLVTYAPASGTAQAITGDVAIGDDRIVFGNGVEVALRPVGADHPGLYVLDPPGNPELLNGNRLCGGEAPDYIGVASRSDELYLKVFYASQPPTMNIDGLPQDGTCATFNYVRR